MNTYSHKYASFCWWSVIALIVVIYAAITWLTPLHLDDWRFLSDWRDFADSKFSLKGLMAYYQEIRTVDNGRFANLLSPFSTAVEPWKSLFPFLNGCAMALIISSSLFFVCPNNWRRNFFCLLIVWGGLLVCLPWGDTIFVADYSLNYVWGTSISLLFLICVIRAQSRGWKSARFLICLVLGLIMAGWHEGFAFTTVFALLCYIIRKKGRLPFQFYIVVFITLIFSIFIYASPGMLGRTGNDLFSFDYIPFLRSILSSAFPSILLLFVWILFSFFKAGRQILRRYFSESFSLIGLAILFSGYLIAFCTSPTPRTFFWPNIWAVILMIRPLYLAFSSAIPFRIQMVGSILMILILTAQSIFTMVWQFRYLKEYNEIMAKMGASESGTVFHDVMAPRSLPKAALKIPVREAWINPVYSRSLYHFFVKPFIAVVPTELQDASPDKGIAFENNLNARIYQGHLIAPLSPQFNHPENLQLEFNDKGVKKSIFVNVFPFVADHSGKSPSDTLLYLYADPASISRIQQSIK